MPSRDGDTGTAERRIKDDALRRLREATPKEMAVFADKLRAEALEAGATEDDLSKAENLLPGESSATRRALAPPVKPRTTSSSHKVLNAAGRGREPRLCGNP